MILLMMVAAVTPVPSAEQRFEACIALSETEPAKALEVAGDWQAQSGGVLARQCAGVAYATQKRWLPAIAAFEQAAKLAERERDGRAARLWVQAGNAALAIGDMARARSNLDAALANDTLVGFEAGEAYLDRARARAGLADAGPARSDLDRAIKLVPNDPLVWLLSAALARRTGDLSRARIDIAEALRLAPDEASVALEAGNIAAVSGVESAARTAWQAVIKASPDSPMAKAAAEAIAALDTP